MSLYDRPTLAELIDAVREYLQAEVAPGAADRRARFRALIAVNVLAIAQRELAGTAAANHAEQERLRALGFAADAPAADRGALARAIRAGAYDGAAQHLRALSYAKAATAAKLAVSNPKFLAEYVPY